MAEVVIYHHCDADGFGSAAVIQSQYIVKEDTEYTFSRSVITQPVNFDTPIDFGLIDDETKEMYILDYSISRQDDIDHLSEVCKKYPDCKLIYIDHHKTTGITITRSKEVRENIYSNIGLYLDTEDFGYSAAFLAHVYVKNPSLAKEANQCALQYRKDEKLCNCKEVEYIKTKLREEIADTPIWIHYISDHDAWQKKLLRSDAFVKGMTKVGLRIALIDISNNDCLSIYYSTNKKWLNPLIKCDEIKIVSWYVTLGMKLN